MSEITANFAAEGRPHCSVDLLEARVIRIVDEAADKILMHLDVENAKKLRDGLSVAIEAAETK